MKIKTGSLVYFVPSASSTFKWEKYLEHKAPPGLVLREVEARGTTTRRFEIRWHDGEISEEWVTYLKPFDNSLTT